MNVRAINSVSFGAKADKIKSDKGEGRKRYFEYLSKNAANDALKMSKGREEEDGKFKFATFVTGAAAVIGVYASGMAKLSARRIGKEALNMREKGKEIFNNATQLLERNIVPDESVLRGASEKIAEASKLAAKSLSRNKMAETGLLISALAGTAAIAIKQVNERRADKTANDRGFYTINQRLGIKGAENVYSEVEKVYDNHVAK